MSAQAQEVRFLDFQKQVSLKQDKPCCDWSVEPLSVFLSIAEKEKIEALLSRNENEKAVFILRKNYRWVQQNEHKLPNAEKSLEHLKKLAGWVQNYPEQVIVESETPPDTTINGLWDWVCDSIAEGCGLFKCESSKQAQDYLCEVEHHLPNGFGIVVIREKELNLYRTA